MVQVADLEELRREIKAIAESLWSLRGAGCRGRGDGEHYARVPASGGRLDAAWKSDTGIG